MKALTQDSLTVMDWINQNHNQKHIQRQCQCHSHIHQHFQLPQNILIRPALTCHLSAKTPSQQSVSVDFTQPSASIVTREAGLGCKGSGGGTPEPPELLPEPLAGGTPGIGSSNASAYIQFTSVSEGCADAASALDAAPEGNNIQPNSQEQLQ